MTCTELRPLIPALVDGELDPDRARDAGAHLAACDACRRAHDRERAASALLRERLPAWKAPDALRARVLADVRGAGAMPASDVPARATPRRAFPWRALAIAASVLFVLTTGVSTWRARASVSRGDALAAELLASHLRSLVPGHLADVASTDQHTVKPWFDGRLDFSPDVHDLATRGFPLLGGRLDYVGERPVAVLVYGRRKHIINLFVWPGPAPAISARGEATRRGYHLVQWTHAGMTYCAVSDLNVDELRQFTRLQREMEDADAARDAAAR